jgi:hypothetical protein
MVIEGRHPTMATTHKNPAKRQGRVYLDWGQNAHGQLLVAPYSVRPVPHAPVSMPLRWHEVTPELDPRAFTIRTARARIDAMGDDPVRAITGDLLKALGKRRRSSRPAAGRVRAATLARGRGGVPGTRGAAWTAPAHAAGHGTCCHRARCGVDIAVAPPARGAGGCCRGADAPMYPAHAGAAPADARRQVRPGAGRGQAGGGCRARNARRAAEARPRGAIDHGRAWATLPPTYPMKALSPANVAVSLTGEPVSVYAMAPPGDPPPTREVRGRVLEGGAPAAGVTVVVGDRLMVFAGHLNGAAAAVTDGDGRFTLAAPPTARWALALGPHSWSALTPVADGELAIALAPAAAGLEVTVREDGAPLDATLALTLGDGVVAGTFSAPDGVFRFAALPPGPARLTVGASPSCQRQTR